MSPPAIGLGLGLGPISSGSSSISSASEASPSASPTAEFSVWTTTSAISSFFFTTSSAGMSSVQPSPARPPAFHPPGPAKGPRSLGVRGSFRSSPQSNLPPTVYTRDRSTNPLIPLTPDLSLAHISPAQHLRALKKRSLATRNFGSTGGNDGGLSGGPAFGIAPNSPSIDSSPTIASSPTMGSSPTVMASPTMASDRTAPHTNTLTTSLALSIVFGLLLLGLGSWAGMRYHRRRLHRQQAFDPESDLHSRETLTHPDPDKLQHFDASNVVEKGLRPRSSTSSSVTIRPKSIFQAKIESEGGSPNGRRVSFIDVPVQGDSMLDISSKLYASPVGEGRNEAFGGARSSTLSAIEWNLHSSRPTSSISVMSNLDPIEEEDASLSTSYTFDSIPTCLSPLPIDDDISSAPSTRRCSVASTVTSGAVSNYTTASARSSISDLTTLSTMSCLSSFPETPQASESGSARSPILDLSRSSSPTTMSYDTPTKSFGTTSRKARARSQTVVNVKHVDMLRTAVGKTMSLQPSKQVKHAFQTMAEGDEGLRVLEGLIRGREDLVYAENTDAMDEVVGDLSKDGMEVVEASVADDEAAYVRGEEKGESGDDITLVGDLDLKSKEPSPRPENGMKKVLFALEPIPSRTPSLSSSSTSDDESLPPATVTRSMSFPSKLLSRRKSLSSNPSLPGGGLRRSEVLSGGYFKRALRAFRGEEAMPPLPLHYPAAFPPHIRRYSTDSIESNRSEDGAFSFDAYAPGWGNDTDIPDFDAYYLDFQIAAVSDNEDEVEEGGPTGHVPHIRVTSH